MEGEAYYTLVQFKKDSDFPFAEYKLKNFSIKKLRKAFCIPFWAKSISYNYVRRLVN